MKGLWDEVDCCLGDEVEIVNCEHFTSRAREAANEDIRDLVVDSEYEGEEVSMAGEGEEISIAGEGEEVSMAGEGEEVSIAGEGEEVSIAGEGEEVSMAGEGEEVSIAQLNLVISIDNLIVLKHLGAEIFYFIIPLGN